MTIFHYKLCRITKIAPSPHSVEARLPAIYQKYVQDLKKEPSPVHYIPEQGKWKFHPVTNQRLRVENRPIPLKFPKEADEGIWGGEGIIQGFTKDIKRRRRRPKFWIPKLQKATLYSEILNRYIYVPVTERALNLIDQNCGFDNYILNTPVQDLKSQLALTLRRKMLLALVNNEQHHESIEKHKEVLEKYKKFMVSKEEAEWFGLTLREAVQKQRLLEEESKNPQPLKHALMKIYLEQLKEKKEKGLPEEEEEAEATESGYKSWLSKINPFAPK